MYNNAVDSSTCARLLELNRKFYSQFSADFSATRSSERFNIEPFRKFLANDIRLLDAGCGNGRLAGALARAGLTLAYVGIDGSPELVAFAQKKNATLRNVRAQFRVVDLTLPRWSESLRDAPPFDVIVSLAVLHHIPSFALRANVLREIRARLKPNGIFVMSNWQFLNDERLRKKIVAPDKIAPGEWRLDPGDYFLDWKRGGVGYRYVHWIDETKVEDLADASGWQVVEQFLADKNLNLYSVLR
ncbi:class I SAM-dependent methyltransferase [Anaerolineae bacterium CFX7]|nr:class I SAM-dependent methyltransferase [Anaerolineae bacterium CFX7]